MDDWDDWDDLDDWDDYDYCYEWQGYGDDYFINADDPRIEPFWVLFEHYIKQNGYIVED